MMKTTTATLSTEYAQHLIKHVRTTTPMATAANCSARSVKFLSTKICAISRARTPRTRSERTEGKLPQSQGCGHRLLQIWQSENYSDNRYGNNYCNCGDFLYASFRFNSKTCSITTTNTCPVHTCSEREFSMAHEDERAESIVRVIVSAYRNSIVLCRCRTFTII